MDDLDPPRVWGPTRIRHGWGGPQRRSGPRSIGTRCVDRPGPAHEGEAGTGCGGSSGSVADFPSLLRPSVSRVGRRDLHFVDRGDCAFGDVKQLVSVVGRDRSKARFTFFVKLGHERVPVLVTWEPFVLRPPIRVIIPEREAVTSQRGGEFFVAFLLSLSHLTQRLWAADTAIPVVRTAASRFEDDRTAPIPFGLWVIVPHPSVAIDPQDAAKLLLPWVAALHMEVVPEF